MLRQRHILRLKRRGIRDHPFGKRRIDEPLNRRHTSIARRQIANLPAGSFELIADSPIRADIRPAKPIDRLLWIANDEELAGNRTYLLRLTDGDIIRGEKQQDL